MKTVKASELKNGDILADPLRAEGNVLEVVDVGKLMSHATITVKDVEDHTFVIMMSPEAEVKRTEDA